MPPVAFGDESDLRRWGFQGDNSPEATVGAMHWPHHFALGGSSISANADVKRLKNGDPYAEVVASGGIEDGREPLDDSTLFPQGFRGIPDRASPGPQPMDPRMGGDSNGTMMASGSGASSVTCRGSSGQSSRQGSPFMAPFGQPSQQAHGGAMMDSSSPGVVSPYGSSSPRIISAVSGGGASTTTVSGQQTRPSGRGPLPSLPRHRPVYEDPVGMSQHSEHSSSQHAQPLGHDPTTQSSEGIASGGILSDGGLALQGSMGATACIPSSTDMSIMSLGPSARASPGIVGPIPSQQQQQQQQQQEQQHRQNRTASAYGNSGGGGTVVEAGPGHRAGSIGPLTSGGPSPPEDPSSRSGSDVPTVLEHFPGFVRCVMPIAPEVVGWVIGRSGSHIKDSKLRSGCGMWVDQKELKLYITGPDMPRIVAATQLVKDLISRAPVNVNCAGVEDEVTSHMIECPPHLIGLLIGRGGSTIKRIKEESRANVVINQKMMKVIVSGIPQSVRLGVSMIEEVITFGRSAEHGAGMRHRPNLIDFPGGGGYVGMPPAMGAGVPNGTDFDNDRFCIRGGGVPPMSGGGRLPPPPPPPTPPFSGAPSSIGGGGGGQILTPPYTGPQCESSWPPGGMLQQSQQSQQAQHKQRRMAGDMGQGRGSHHSKGVMVPGVPGGRMEEGPGRGQPARYQGSEMDWSVFSASSFNIGLDGQHQQLPPLPHGQHQSASSSGNGSNGGGGGSGGGGGAATRSSVAGGGHVGSSRTSGPSGVGNSGGGGVGGAGTPPQTGTSGAAPVIGSLGSKVVGSPTMQTVSATMQSMSRLSITDETTTGGQSIGQANKHRERGGSPVGDPVNLAEFLEDMGLGDYAKVLGDNEIDLEAVQLMADSDFQDIGIPKGPRVKLLYALRTKRHPPKSGDIAMMRSFLTSLGLERYCKTFEDEGVDMGAVDVMDESDYAELGVAKGPRLKIMNFLAKSGGLCVPSLGSRSSSAAGSASGSPEARDCTDFSGTPPTTNCPFSANSAAGIAPAAVPRPLRTPPPHASSSGEPTPERSETGSSREAVLDSPIDAAAVRAKTSSGESDAPESSSMVPLACTDSETRSPSPENVEDASVAALAADDSPRGDMSAVEQDKVLAEAV